MSDMEVDSVANAEVSAEVAVDTDADNESKKSVNDVAKEVLAGHWGRGHKRNERLSAAGYDPAGVDKEIEDILK